MKFTLKIILAAVLLVVLVGCGKKPFDREHADFKYLDEEGVLWMHLNLNKGFTSSHTIDTVRADVLRILEVLYKDGLIPDDTVEVDFAFEGVLTDSFGNDQSQVVAEIGFFPETIGKINFDKISRKRMPDFADYYWNHPAYD